MIGGHDIAIPAAYGEDALDIILRLMRRAWPKGCVEDAEGIESWDIQAPVPRGQREAREFFVYRDRASMESWERDGATDANEEAMIHFILGPTELTCVIAGGGGPNERIVRDLEGALRNKRRSLDLVALEAAA